mgnify:FL=1|tara:strand:+ start:2489 stop:2959 length:471 start_codon:yes stop_codon:yes gene_type:complete
MNLILLPSTFNIENINLLRKKENTIVDGNFSKFTYATDTFIMNGIYLFFPVNKLTYTYDTKFIYNTYPPYDKANINYIKQISKIEMEILEYYKHVNNIHKKSVDIISKKLYSGNIRLYSNTNPNFKINHLIIKISGIWETNDEVGLAIRLLYNGEE